MALVFEIMRITHRHNRGHFIFARSLNGELNFEMKDGATLGGIPVYHYVEMPRVLDDNGQPRLDIFVFRPWPQLSTINFAEGQHVELVLPK